MWRQLFGFKMLFALIAVSIVVGTIFYSRYISNKIAHDERKKVEMWAAALKSFFNVNNNDALPQKVINSINDIPIIETNENDSITYFQNIDSLKATQNPGYLDQQLKKLKSINEPIIYFDELDTTGQRFNKYYYGHTILLNEAKYYPILQLIIVGLFIVVIFYALRSSYRSTQNQVWAGMAKETAHQLGTPVSSLQGWIEMLKEKEGNEQIVTELEKDVDRLKLVSERFGKIGSTPKLEEKDILWQVKSMVDYIKRRAPGRVSFEVNHENLSTVIKNISPPLFDWVIENLLKNALDSMDGNGSIKVHIFKNDRDEVFIDVKDSGKGIAAKNIDKVFNPGFTTKKRGWGLGLSLSKRIISDYHKGEIFVKHSEPGKGTTFRIILKK